MALCNIKCLPCKEATSLSNEEIEPYLPLVPLWRLVRSPVEPTYIARDFVARSFDDACDIIAKVASLADWEGHHPDVHLVRYKNLSFCLRTYSAKVTSFSRKSASGLSVNDFILAAKLDKLLEGWAARK